MELFWEQKKRWNFSIGSIGFWWIKNILLPVPAFTDKITMNVTVIAKTLLSCISHIELRIFLLSKKFLRKKFLNSIGFKNSLSLKKNPWVSKSSIGFKFHRFQNSLGLIITLCRMFLPPEAKFFGLLNLFLFLYYGKRCIWNGFVGLKPQKVSWYILNLKT